MAAEAVSKRIDGSVNDITIISDITSIYITIGREVLSIQICLYSQRAYEGYGSIDPIR